MCIYCMSVCLHTAGTQTLLSLYLSRTNEADNEGGETEAVKSIDERLQGNSPTITHSIASTASLVLIQSATSVTAHWASQNWHRFMFS